MLFKSSYTIENSKSRYETLKLFLASFCDINSTFDEPYDKKSFFGKCENGEFIFKAAAPSDVLYAYKPKCRMKISGDDDNAVVQVKSSTNILLFLFILFIIAALLFVACYFIVFSYRVFIGTGISFAIAALTALFSCKSHIKLKQTLENTLNLCVNSQINDETEKKEVDPMVEKMQLRAEELKKIIGSGKTIDEIVEIFKAECASLNDEDMLLFETGTFDFTGEALFYFSMVKQVSTNSDEYCQLHIEVLYDSNKENKNFSDTFWDETGTEIFNYIKNSDAFKYAQNNEYVKIDVWADET